MHKPKEVAHMLGVTPSTVRRYARHFTDHLSDYTKRRRRKYTDTDVAVLKQAMQLMGEGHTYDEVNRMLYVTEIAPEEDPRGIQKYFPELAQAVEQARAEQAKIHNRIDGIEKAQLEQQEAWQREQEQLDRRERLRFWILMMLLALFAIAFLVVTFGGQ